MEAFPNNIVGEVIKDFIMIINTCIVNNCLGKSLSCSRLGIGTTLLLHV